MLNAENVKPSWENICNYYSRIFKPIAVKRLRSSGDKNQIIDFFNMVGENEVKLRKASRFVVGSKDTFKKQRFMGGNGYE